MVKPACFCYNSTPHETTKLAPIEILIGKPPLMPHHLIYLPRSQIAPSVQVHIDRIKSSIDVAHKIAQKNQQCQQLVCKDYYDKNTNINPEPYALGVDV